MKKISAAKKLDKVVINVGLGKISSLPNFGDKILPEISKEISAITGQKPAERKAKKSISGFKLREGTVVGLQVTLRGKMMFAFIEKLNKIVLPRVRDFRGINPKSIDGNGNLNIGIKETVVFPEINPEAFKTSFGIQITFVLNPVTAKGDPIEIYREIGIPFQKS